jgi:uncharacterized protein (TIGR02246 family)
MIGKTIVLALLLTFHTPMFANDQQQTTVSKAEQEVRQLERRWLDAYEQFDSQTMTTIVADEFVITFPNGSRQNKSELMSMIRNPNKSGPVMRFYTEDVRSRAIGDTVILRGTVVTEYEKDGKNVREKSRYTDTYVKRNGRWQVVASHLSNAEEPRKQQP